LPLNEPTSTNIYTLSLHDALPILEENKNLPKLNDGGIEELQKLIIDNPKIRLIIVDTFGRTIADKRRKDNNSYRADYEIASKLQDRKSTRLNSSHVKNS